MSAARGRPRRVSVAILSWNGRRHLETCLDALAMQRDPGVPWEILVLDNGSRDGTAEWLAVRHPEVRTIASPVNLGFCAGNNRLVAEAAGDAVALLNNDTRPRPEWLAALVDSLAAAPADVAAVSGLILDWDGRRLDFARGAMTFDGHAFQLGFRRPLAEAAHPAGAQIPTAGAELPFACGGNLLVWRDSFLAAGGFDADYFAYLEDVDLGWRLWSGGERVLFAPEAVVHHRSSATSDLLGLFNRGFLFERNAFLTAYKNYEEGLWQRMIPIVLLTLMHRTQTLLERNNPGGSLLTLDPYAGHIANTAPPGGGGGADTAPAGAAARGNSEPGPPVEPVPLSGDALLAGLRDRWQRHGPREFLRRGIVAAANRLLGSRSLDLQSAAPEAPRLTDERTIAQLRALSYLGGHLDAAAAKRRAIQARRRRPDADYLARFPLYVVPTYPGDDELFASEGFRSWLPEGVPLVWSTLAEVMEVG